MSNRGSDNKEASVVLPLAAVITAAACACGGLFHLLLRHKEKLISTEERLGGVEAELASTSERLHTVERELRSSQDENTALKGELGASRSQSLLMKRELNSSQQRLDSLSRELDRSKSASRSGYLDGVWDNEGEYESP